VATAPTARRLLLVEVPGPWGRAGLVSTRLPTEVTGPLAAASDEAGVRVQLIRRPGRHALERDPAPPPDGFRWGLIDAAQDAGAGHCVVRWGSWHAPEDLTAIDVGSPIDPVVHARTGPQRLALVCAHAKRDVCCAVNGRPVAAALDAEVGLDREVWETSHLGGDRFAANLLLLPEGELFAQLDADRAVTVARRLDAGRLALASYRGRIGRPAVEQAMLHHGAALLDDDRLGAVRVVAAPERDGSDWTATVEHSGRRYAVRLEEWWAAPERLSCAAVADKPARRFTVREWGLEGTSEGSPEDPLEEEVRHAG
jgi:hypothetical protein